VTGRAKIHVSNGNFSNKLVGDKNEGVLLDANN
jgi:hypothetical protein